MLVEELGERVEPGPSHDVKDARECIVQRGLDGIVCVAMKGGLLMQS